MHRRKGTKGLDMQTSPAPAGLLFNPHTYDPQHLDPSTRRHLRALIDWFEQRGKSRLLQDDRDAIWVADFLDFIKQERIFATFLTPAEHGIDDPDKRWDTCRNAALSEILGFYGLAYWYTEQVTILGLGPIWQSDNVKATQRAAHQLEAGGVMAFALSERDHGADIYNTDMILTPADNDDEGVVFRASGEKYYIGNGNVAGMVSVFSRRCDISGADGYVWFVANSAHPQYSLLGNVVHGQMYVSNFRLEDYPVREEDILCTGAQAFSVALNTVNIGKFNLCTASIGMCEHAFYEAITHSHRRVLYGNPVTDFPHVRANFVDAYARLMAMKLFSDRAIDYFRSANREDRRYLLFNSVAKAQVTSEGETVVRLLWDVIAAKGFERTTYFAEVARMIGALPRLEGTVHVNIAQIVKFLPNYLLNPTHCASIGTRHDGADDAFLWEQGPAGGVSHIQFDDWASIFTRHSTIANVALFSDQAQAFRQLFTSAAPDADQLNDLDFMLVIGQLFILIVYGQLILEQAEILELDHDLINQIFDISVRDFCARAVELHNKSGSTAAQQQWALSVMRKPESDPDRFDRIWQHVQAYAGAYQMNP